MKRVVIVRHAKSLATESRASAENIAHMIGGLQKKSQAAADAMTSAGSAVIQGNQALSDTLRIFTELTASVQQINENMEHVASATEEQAASFEEITASVNEMSHLVKETAKDAVHSSATSEEALAVVDQITGIITSINKVVFEVSTEMQKFKLKSV